MQPVKPGGTAACKLWHGETGQGTSGTSVLVRTAHWGLWSVGDAQTVRAGAGSSSAEQDSEPELLLVHKYT